MVELIAAHAGRFEHRAELLTYAWWNVRHAMLDVVEAARREEAWADEDMDDCLSYGDC